MAVRDRRKRPGWLAHFFNPARENPQQVAVLTATIARCPCAFVWETLAYLMPWNA
jgi:hypothetical protein